MSGPPRETVGENPREVMRGVPVSPGYAVGRVHLVDRQHLRVPRYHVHADHVDDELARLERAIGASEAQLNDIRDELVLAGNDHHLILDAHLLMLRDEMLTGGVRQLISAQRINAEWALRKVLRGLKQVFDEIEDEYFRERRSDVDFVGDRLLRNLLGSAHPELSLVDAGSVVVARDLSPADTATLDEHAVLAFATDVGGRTSHTAIMARQAQIPAVVALENISERVGHGDFVIVDAVEGLVILHPGPEELARYQALAHDYAVRRAQLDQQGFEPAVTRDGAEVRIRGNIEAAHETEAVTRCGGAGVGLFRTEYLFMNRVDELPDETEQFEAYRAVLLATGADGATIRTLDIGGDKLIASMRRHRELNPVMGLRAVRFCLQERALFRTQLRALLRASAFGHLRLLVPLISGLDEVEAVKALVADVRAELLAEGEAVAESVPFGIMIELPSAAQTADVLADHVDFFSIGTNDLIQYTLAIDRANEQVAHLYQPLHPAVLRQLSFVVRAAKAAGIGVSLCGEMAGDPRYAPVLVGLGLSELSLTPASMAVVKSVLRALSAADCRALVERLNRVYRPLEAEALLADWLSDQLDGRVPREVFDPQRGTVRDESYQRA